MALAILHIANMFPLLNTKTSKIKSLGKKDKTAGTGEDSWGQDS
jgi:hypothetical protein